MAPRQMALRAIAHRQAESSAAIEDVDYRSPRGLDRALFQKLAQDEWIDAHDNLILPGPTGIGKSWLPWAIGHKACRDNRSVLYHRVPTLHRSRPGTRRRPPSAPAALARTRRPSYRGRLRIGAARCLGAPRSAGNSRRAIRPPLDVTSQLPLDRWHEIIADPTYADAILDRLVHNAHRIELTGESMRRTRGKQNQKA